MILSIRPLHWWSTFLAAAILYILLRTFMPISGDWLIKIIPILLLMQWVAIGTKGPTKGLMLLGLTFSLAGDVLLSLEGLFIQGLGAFLVAQLTYTILFVRQAKWQTRRLLWSAFIIAYTTCCIFLILPNSGDLKIVVTAYLCAITLMALTAGFRRDPYYLVCAVGAFVFMVSDTLIAVNKFVTPFSGAGASIMLTYYLAQFLITYGVVRHHQAQ